jgi:hypothetical protein
VTRPPRIRNVSPAPAKREWCERCEDTGFMVHGTRTVKWAGTAPEIEEYAPCWFCERGLGEEFPDYSKRKGAEPLDPPSRPPWGDDGFWQGREPDRLVVLTAKQRPLSEAEQRKKLREFGERMGYIGRDLSESPANVEKVA